MVASATPEFPLDHGMSGRVRRNRSCQTSRAVITCPGHGWTGRCTYV